MGAGMDDPTHSPPDVDQGESSTPATSHLTPVMPSSAVSQHTPASTMAKVPLAMPRYAYIDPNNLPTLIPANIAEIITTLSTTARISLRVSAFLVEAILDTSQFTSRISIDYTRRMLISALASAQRARAIGKGTATEEILRALGLVSGNSVDSLDKFTSLGVYYIHHAFSLTEMFAMTGFNITSKVVSSGCYLAQESVALFNSIFGSSESSRALSAIITMVKRELELDDQYSEKSRGKLWGLKLLTKALTAFVCLQNMTWSTTSKAIKLKLLYDCTVTDSVTAAQGVAAPDREEEPSAGMLVDDTVLGVTDSALSLNGLGMTSVLSQSILIPDEPDLPPQQRSRNGNVSFEVTHEHTGSTTVTQTYQQSASTHRPRAKHRRMQSEPRLSGPFLAAAGAPFSADPSPSPSDQSASESWNEVDEITDGASTGLPSSPNGYTSVAGMKRSESSTKISSSEHRAQLVIRTMTEKLFSRRRIIRREPSDEDLTDPISPERNHTISKRSDVASVRWNQTSGLTAKSSARPATSTLTASPTLISHKVRELFVKRPTRDSDTNAEMDDLDTLPVVHGKRNRSPSIASSSSPRLHSGGHPDTNVDYDDEMDDVQASGFPPAPPSSPETEVRVLRAAGPSATNEAVLDEPTTKPRVVPRPSVVRPRPPAPAPRAASASAGDNGEAPASSASSQPQVTVTTRDLPQTGTDSPGQLYPHDTLTNNIARFMRFSSAVYGDNFLRLLGMSPDDIEFPSNGGYHANTWAFAHHTNLPIENVLLSSYTDSTPTLGQQKIPLLVHYLAVDHEAKAVILACRGTLGLSDVLIDLTCDYCGVELDGQNPHDELFAHSGMYRAAINLTSPQSTVHEALVSALTRWPSYGLVVAGHSLGGGVAGLLSIISSMPAEKFVQQNAARTQPVEFPPITTPFVTSFKSHLPAGRPIHCYTYGIPAVASSDLAQYAKGLITSVVHNTDVVPTLSLGLLRDLKYAALTLWEDSDRAEEIVARAVGVRRGNIKYTTLEGEKVAIPGTAQMTSDEIKDKWLLSHVKTLRAGMQSDKLYPPGDVYILDYQECFVTDTAATAAASTDGKQIPPKEAHRVTLHKCESVHERFREPLFTKTMLNDHMPTHYERATKLLVDGLANKVAAASGSPT